MNLISLYKTKEYCCNSSNLSSAKNGVKFSKMKLPLNMGDIFSGLAPKGV